LRFMVWCEIVGGKAVVYTTHYLRFNDNNVT
jgi:hypothetical protein